MYCEGLTVQSQSQNTAAPVNVMHVYNYCILTNLETNAPKRAAGYTDRFPAIWTNPIILGTTASPFLNTFTANLKIAPDCNLIMAFLCFQCCSLCFEVFIVLLWFPPPILLINLLCFERSPPIWVPAVGDMWCHWHLGRVAIFISPLWLTVIWVPNNKRGRGGGSPKRKSLGVWGGHAPQISFKSHSGDLKPTRRSREPKGQWQGKNYVIFWTYPFGSEWPESDIRILMMATTNEDKGIDYIPLSTWMTRTRTIDYIPSPMITITNDKERLIEEQTEKMIKEAEQFADDAKNHDRIAKTKKLMITNAKNRIKEKMIKEAEELADKDKEVDYIAKTETITIRRQDWTLSLADIDTHRAKRKVEILAEESECKAASEAKARRAEARENHFDDEDYIDLDLQEELEEKEQADDRKECRKQTLITSHCQQKKASLSPFCDNKKEAEDFEKEADKAAGH